MAKNYRDPEFALLIAELIEKHQASEKGDSRLSKVSVTVSSMAATTKYFVHSSRNWFPSVISLDKPFRYN